MKFVLNAKVMAQNQALNNTHAAHATVQAKQRSSTRLGL